MGQHLFPYSLYWRFDFSFTGDICPIYQNIHLDKSVEHSCSYMPSDLRPLQVYRVSDMELVKVLPSAEDEVNVACFHPIVGGGLAYGTKVALPVSK